MIHGHEVLDMMEGHSYASRAELVAAIVTQFGADAKFYTCSTSDLTAEGLVEFLEAHGKFKPAGNTGFTADRSKRCHHEA